MQTRRAAIVPLALLALCLCVPDATAARRQAILLTPDSSKIGPGTALAGTLSVNPGSLALLPWMFEPDDSIEGNSFKIRTEHTRQSAAAARLRVAYGSAIPKGIVAEIDAPPGARLRVETSVGSFDLDPDALPDTAPLPQLDGRFSAQRLPDARALTGTEAEEEAPCIAILPDGRAAVSFVRWDGTADRVALAIDGRVRTLTPQPGAYLDPRCATDGAGRLHTVWCAREGDQWDLWLDAGDAPVRLTRTPNNEFWPRVARHPDGSLWLAWQTVADDLHYEIHLARLTPEGLGPAANVSEHPADDWEPDLCAAPDGRIALAWDSYRNGSFDVYLREFRPAENGTPRPISEARPIAAGRSREAHATVAADSRSRIWIAWEVACEDWGKHPSQKGASLHSERSIDLACLDEGRLRRPAADLQGAIRARCPKYAEYPRVAIDGRDRPWLLFRHANGVTPIHRANAKARAQNYALWLNFVTRLDGATWTQPVPLHRTNGRQDVRASVAPHPDGRLLAVCTTDGRTRAFPYRPVDADLTLTALAPPAADPGPIAWADAPDLGTVTRARPDPELDPLPRDWRIGAQRYSLVIGDTHRHTDISRCANGRDGSLQDAYRYAIDAAGLDWIAISDHDQDILRHRNDRIERPRQAHDWWRSIKACDLHSIPGRFVALYGYEHGGSYHERGGHKNVIYSTRESPVLELDSPEQLFAALADSGAIAVPHQLADGNARTDWEKWDPKRERVAEIFQARGSYEYAGCPREASIQTAGNTLWDALARGVRIGIIASSDHGQTHQARAGAFVKSPANATRSFTRADILEALDARRTFGATTAVSIRASIGDAPQGSEIEIAGAPSISAEIRAPAAVRQFDIIRDGHFVYSISPGNRAASLTFQDLDLAPGQNAYYYARALIGEEDVAWSSPIWVARARSTP